MDIKLQNHNLSLLKGHKRNLLHAELKSILSGNSGETNSLFTLWESSHSYKLYPRNQKMNGKKIPCVIQHSSCKNMCCTGVSKVLLEVLELKPWKRSVFQQDDSAVAPPALQLMPVLPSKASSLSLSVMCS